MIDTYNVDDYYTAAEVAKVVGLSKNTVINRCKAGHYDGAFKQEPTSTSPHGQWMIPKTVIDDPVATHDVAMLTRQVSPVELERAIGRALIMVTEPLHQKIDQQAAMISALQEKIAALTEQVPDREFILRQLASNTEALKTKLSNEPRSFWDRLLGRK